MGKAHRPSTATGSGSELLPRELWLVNATLITPEYGKVKYGVIHVVDGVICRVGTAAHLAPPKGTEVYDLKDGYVVPGFVDLHVHGGGGRDFRDVDRAGIEDIVAAHWRGGTTTLLGTVMTGPRASVMKSLRLIGEAIDEGGLHGTLAGVNLEGPFLSGARPGAHDAKLLKAPSVKTFMTLNRKSGGNVRLMTVAPEDSRAPILIEACVKNGVVPAIGHTDARYEECKTAISLGATHFTHLFNAMTPFHHRKPGVVGAALLEDGVSVELILDGEHLSRQAFELARRLCGDDRIIAITDAMMLAGTKATTGVLGGQTVHRRGQRIENERGDLAGSCLTMAGVFRSLVKTYGVDMLSAIKMTSTNAARVLQRHDLGAIRTGNLANLVVLNKSYDVTLVLSDGVPVHSMLDKTRWRQTYVKEREYTALELADSVRHGKAVRLPLENCIEQDLSKTYADGDYVGELSQAGLERAVRLLADELLAASRLYRHGQHEEEFRRYYSARRHRLLTLETYYGRPPTEWIPFWDTFSADFLEDLFANVLAQTWTTALQTAEGFPRTIDFRVDKPTERSCISAFRDIGARTTRRLWSHYVEHSDACPTEDDQQEYLRAWVRVAAIKLHTAIEARKYEWVLAEVQRLAKTDEEMDYAPRALACLLRGVDDPDLHQELHISSRRAERLLQTMRANAVKLHSRAAAYDFHVHTRGSDGAEDPTWLIKNLDTMLAVKNLDGLAVMDHDNIHPAIAGTMHSSQYRGKLFVGEEVEMFDRTEVSCLFLGGEPADTGGETPAVGRGADLRETVDNIIELGGVVYLTHPTDTARNYSFFREDKKEKEAWIQRHLAEGRPLVVELTNAKSPAEANARAWDEFDRPGLSRVGGSDCHWAELDLGQGFVICDPLDGTEKDFLAKTGRSLASKPVERSTEWDGLRNMVGRHAETPRL